MKIKSTFALCALLVLFLCGAHTVSFAQDASTAAVWQVVRFDITANAPSTERTLTARAQITARNSGSRPLSTFSVRINPKAEITAASVNDASATHRRQVESVGKLLRVTVPLASAVEPNGTVKVGFEYRLPLEANSGLAALSPIGSQFLPRSYWYPVPNNPFVMRGAEDTAPFRLTVNASAGETVVSSGKAAGATFEQTLNAQPFFLTGNWDVLEGANEGRGISVWLPRGAGADERKQAEAIIALAANARSFYASVLGAAPDAPIRFITVARGAGFNDAGTLLLDYAAFRRGKIDASTATLISETISRLWVGGATRLRGEGVGVLHEGLVRYLTGLFIEKQFGRESAEALRLRERVSYAGIARRDPPLMQSSPLDDTYFTSTANKGAMIWRLAERALTRDAFLSVVRERLQTGARDGAGLTLAALRAALVDRGGASLKSVLDQGLDQPTDMDLMIGLPQQQAGKWTSALRNLGSVDVNVTVLAITDRGERLTTEAAIPAREFGRAVFNTPARIVRVEVDPDKLYPQIDYTNDIMPRPDQNTDRIVEANRLFVQQQYAQVEAALREHLSLTPFDQEARILLARALLAQNKLPEAEKEFRALLDDKLPLARSLAWGQIGMAEIALKRGQAAEAAKRYQDAVRADAEYAATLVARAGRIKAEATANAASAVEESARSFIAQLDQAIKSGRKNELEALVVNGELTDFIKGVVGSQPEVWQTRVLRTEQIDSTRLAADVTLNVRQLGNDLSGTAVLILARSGAGWKLADIQFFEVR